MPTKQKKTTTKTTSSKQATKPITIYQYAFCPFTWKVKAFLAHKNIPYKTIEVNHRTKEEIKFSTYKKVPIVVDANGQQINDSTTIIKTLDKQYGEPMFIESKSLNNWIDWADNNFVKAIPSVIYETLGKSYRVFQSISTSPNLSLIDKWYLKLGGTFFMYLKGKQRAKEQGIKSPTDHFKQLLDTLNRTLTKTPYLIGKDESAADLVVFGYIKSIEKYDDFTHIKSNDALSKWYFNLNQKLFNDE